MSRFNLFAVSSLGETRKSAARKLCVYVCFFLKKNSAPEKQQIVRALTVVLTLFQNSAHTLAVPVSASTRVYRSFRFHLHNSVFIFTFVYLRRIKRRGPVFPPMSHRNVYKRLHGLEIQQVICPDQFWPPRLLLCGPKSLRGGGG